MYPSQVKQEYINQYGPFQVKSFNVGSQRINIASFPSTPSRAMLAQEFGTADVLRNDTAKQMLDNLLEQNNYDLSKVTTTQWEEIGKLEELPEYEPLPVEIQKNINNNLAACDFSNLVWDQTTSRMVITALQRVQDSNVLAKQPNPYTAYVGKPGTSKSKASRILAAVLGRPIFNLNAEQVSPENLQARITGEESIVGNPSTAALKLASIGGLTQPDARREYLNIITKKKRFEAINLKEWASIAEKEGLSQGTLYTIPGMAKLAKKYGGIFNIEEMNCLRGDGFTLLTTNVLDVYDQDNPNYYVIANMNPTSDQHLNRTPLPVEIADRFGQPIEVEPLNKQELTQALMCNFTGMQPTIKYKGENLRLSNETFNIDNDESAATNILSTILDPSCISKLVNNITDLHKTIESHIEKGTLNKCESQVPQTQDHTILTRRGLSLFVQGVISNMFNAVAEFDSSSVYQDAPDNDTVTEKVTKDIFIDAITDSIENYYVTPYTFMAQKIRLMDASNNKSQNISPDQSESTDSFIRDCVQRCKLDKESLNDFIITTSQSVSVINNLKDKLNDLNITTDLQSKITSCKEFKKFQNTIVTLNTKDVSLTPTDSGGLLMTLPPVVINKDNIDPNLSPHQNPLHLATVSKYNHDSLLEFTNPMKEACPVDTAPISLEQFLDNKETFLSTLDPLLSECSKKSQYESIMVPILDPDKAQYLKEINANSTLDDASEFTVILFTQSEPNKSQRSPNKKPSSTAVIDKNGVEWELRKIPLFNMYTSPFGELSNSEYITENYLDNLSLNIVNIPTVEIPNKKIKSLITGLPKDKKSQNEKAFRPLTPEELIERKEGYRDRSIAEKVIQQQNSTRFLGSSKPKKKQSEPER